MAKFLERKGPRAMAALLLLLDAGIINASPYVALWFRFDMSVSGISGRYLEAAAGYAWIHTALTLAIFAAFRLYASLWRFASVRELASIACACLASMASQIIGMGLMGYAMPRSYYPLCCVVMGLCVAAVRFSYRLARILKAHRRLRLGGRAERVMVVGGGSAGSVIIRELKDSQRLHKKVACIIDDDPGKLGKRLDGVRIAGNRGDIGRLAKELSIDEIIVAMPGAARKDVGEILSACSKTGCGLRYLPGVYQLINGEVSVSKLRKARIEDLLGREPVALRLGQVGEYVSGKVVMVTGAGGSIGSELCRQVAGYGPKRLVLFDVYENSVYDVQQELKAARPGLDMRVLIGSVRDQARVEGAMEENRPDIVFHAAAHKHVPLMEDSPREAVKNNVTGTYNVARAAGEWGVGKFVLISTDKAVRPTNVMGASKRACELVIQAFNQEYGTEYAAVRFGNVLGSNGSVIPLFEKQIAAGGPVQVTHPDIVRYFMTIPEAVSLVLQAGAFAKGGEVFILDMGEPVKILDLARNMIRLSGYVPGVDMEVEIIGLRPGEKLYEELLADGGHKERTANDRIFVGRQEEIDPEEILEKARELGEEADREGDVFPLLKALVPEYRPMSQAEQEAACAAGEGPWKGPGQEEKGGADGPKGREKAMPRGAVHAHGG